MSGIRSTTPFQDGILLSPQEQAALAAAPRRPPGTEVTVRAKRIPLLFGQKDHTFTNFDDGSDWLIARGGPALDGLRLYTGGQVDPASASPDYMTGYRTLARKRLYGVSAEEAAEPARRLAQGVNREGNSYGWATNSNSFSGEVDEPIFGYRPGDDRTPGYQTHLRAGPPQPLLNRFQDLAGQLPDLTPVLRYPPY